MLLGIFLLGIFLGYRGKSCPSPPKIIVPERNQLGKEELRAIGKEKRVEELVWFLGADLGSRNVWGKRGEGPDLALDPVDIQRLKNGNTLVTDNSAHQVFEVTPDYKIVWEFGEYGVCKKDAYHLCVPSTGRFLEKEKAVLIGDGGNKRILLVDYEKREIRKKLEKTERGRFGLPVVTHNPFNNRLVVADADNHFVAEVDWKGKIYSSFGVYGKSGNDKSHLNGPRYAEVSFDYPDFLTIADYGNSRAIFFSKAGNKIEREFMVRWPRWFRQMADGYVVLCSDEDRAVLTDYLGRVWWWWSYPSVFMERTPDKTFLLSWTRDTYEVKWSFEKTASLPYTRRMLEEQLLSSGESLGPVYSGATKVLGVLTTFGFGYDKITVSAKSSERVLLEVLSAIPKLNELYFDRWESIVTLDLKDNLFKTFTLTETVPVLGFRITNQSQRSAKVDLAVSHE